MHAFAKLQQERIRVVVTAASPLCAGEIARDLAAHRSLHITPATSVASLWQAIENAHANVVLLDTRLAGEQTPRLVRELVQRTKLAVLIRTELVEASTDMLLDCLDAGALSILTKPTNTEQIARSIPSLVWSIKAAAQANLTNLPKPALVDSSVEFSGASTSILAIGAGMGGSVGLGNLLAKLPANAPATIVVAPLPPRLVGPWINRLTNRCQLRIQQATNARILQPGAITIAPGNTHLMLRRSNSNWTIDIKDGPEVFYQKPSMEVLLNSIADAPAPDAVGVLLSGAGVDGIAGLLRLRKAGGRTLTESPDSCLFSDLPTRAMQCRAAEASYKSEEIIARMLELAEPRKLPSAA